MEINHILTPDCTRCAVPGSSKKRIIEIISAIAHQALPELEEADITASLMCREKMGSTGIGHGIAVPHGRIVGLQQTLGILVTCKPAIMFDAIDNQPVDVFFALLVPEGEEQEHLKTLGCIAAKLQDKNAVKQMRHAADDQALYKSAI